jgi:hypothetical protein
MGADLWRLFYTKNCHRAKAIAANHSAPEIGRVNVGDGVSGEVAS